MENRVRQRARVDQGDAARDRSILTLSPGCAGGTRYGFDS